MTRDRKIWILIAVFQVVYGMTIFTLTRDYYLDLSDRSGARTVAIDRSTSMPPSTNPGPAFPAPGSPAFDGASVQDPVQISRQAEEYFAKKDYERAADLYARLLQIAPNDVDTHNNLGLTLHYLNRSTEALRTLNEGVAIDPENQRIWLTLGYVNSQVGNFEQASKALTTATLIGNDEAIRKSAMEMLGDLP
jgi:tetratricopeptide (TPR) repeat protein